VKQFHENDNPRNPQKRERGPNKTKSQNTGNPANQEGENSTELYHRKMVELAHASWGYN